MPWYHKLKTETFWRQGAFAGGQSGGGLLAMKRLKARVGLRTVKTAASILIAMVIVDRYGTSTAKLVFAMLGAMAVVQPTFKASLEACVAQIFGVIFGSVVAVLLMLLPFGHLLTIGIGIILVITIYNMLHLTASPSLPCFILVMICTTPDIVPLDYAAGRIWDTAIGLGVGMLVNLLVFPYDNSRKIRATIESLDQDLICFLEEMFDGGTVQPDAERLSKKITAMEKQLNIFANQLLLLHLRRQRQELEKFRLCDRKAKELVSHMEVLGQMERPGRLSDESRRRLSACGAEIRDERPLDSVMELDVVTNYHVGKILTLRLELMEALEGR